MIARDVGASILTRHEAAQGHQQRDDFFAGNFEAASDAVARKAWQAVAVDQVGWRIPGCPVLVEVEVLQRDGHDQVAPPGQYAGALRSTQTFAAAEGDQVGPSVDEPSQVACGW